MTVNLTDPIFHDEDAARRHFEALRWPDGPICPHCGSVANATEMKGKSTRIGHNTLADGSRSRSCKRCGTSLDK